MARDLLAALGWAVFVGGGVALGLWLGSLGADVPADSGMLVITGLIAGSATLTVRIAMAIWKHRPGARVAAGGAAEDAAPASATPTRRPPAGAGTGRPSRSAPPARTRRRASAPPPEDEGEGEADDASPRAPSRTRKRPAAEKPTARKPAERKPPARRKRPEGGSGSSRRGR